MGAGPSGAWARAGREKHAEKEHTHTTSVNARAKEPPVNRPPKMVQLDTYSHSPSSGVYPPKPSWLPHSHGCRRLRSIGLYSSTLMTVVAPRRRGIPARWGRRADARMRHPGPVRSRNRMAILTRELFIVVRIDVAIAAHGALVRKSELGVVEYCT